MQRRGRYDTQVVKNLNPVNWFGDDEEEKEKKPLQAGKSSPARQSFQRLGDVPSRPKKPTLKNKRTRNCRRLAADTQNAKYSDQQLRQSAAVFGGRGQPQRTIQRSQPIPVARPAVRAPTPRISRPVAAPPVRPPSSVASPTVRPPQTVLAPQPVRAPTTQRSAFERLHLSSSATAATGCRHLWLRDPQRQVQSVAPPRPVAAPPAPKTPRITPPPPVAAKPALAEQATRTRLHPLGRLWRRRRAHGGATSNNTTTASACSHPSGLPHRPKHRLRP